MIRVIATIVRSNTVNNKSVVTKTDTVSSCYVMSMVSATKDMMDVLSMENKTDKPYVELLRNLLRLVPNENNKWLPLVVIYGDEKFGDTRIDVTFKVEKV